MREALGQAVPVRPAPAARDGRARGVWQLDGRARRGVPQGRGHYAGHGRRDCRQRPGDGVWQHGQRQRDRRCVYARPRRRQPEAVRRVPDQRPGRGCGGRHAHAQPNSAPARRDARHACRACPRVQAARGPLPRAAGHRVHRGARPVLPAADARGQDQRRGDGKVLRRHGARGPDNQGAGPAPPKDRKAGAAAAPDAGGKGRKAERARGVGHTGLAGGRVGNCGVRRGPRGQAYAKGSGNGQGVGNCSVRRGPRKGDEQGGARGHTCPRGDKARGCAGVLQVGRHTDEQGRQVVPCRRRRPWHGQAVHRGHVRLAHKLQGPQVHHGGRRGDQGGRYHNDRRQHRGRVSRRPSTGRPEGHARVPHCPAVGAAGQEARRQGQRRHARRGRKGARVRRAGHWAVPNRAHVQRGGTHLPVPGHDNGVVGRRQAPPAQKTRGHATSRL